MDRPCGRRISTFWPALCRRVIPLAVRPQADARPVRASIYKRIKMLDLAKDATLSQMQLGHGSSRPGVTLVLRCQAWDKMALERWFPPCCAWDEVDQRPSTIA